MQKIDDVRLSAFSSFIVSPQGRALRVGLGLSIMAWGFASRRPGLGALGLVPFLAGTFDLFLEGPFVGGSFSGQKTRRLLEDYNTEKHRQFLEEFLQPKFRAA